MQLLATKLHAPRPRPGVVRRRRLAVTSTLVSTTRVTLVSAPAGFGKSTLLADWFSDPSDNTSVTAWLSLDSGDDDTGVFWTYVVAAIRRVAPAVGAQAAEALQSAQPAASVVMALLNDLNDHAGVTLVLDDYHVIESNDVHESVAYLIEHGPPSLHIVVASRSDPPLPLARLRARGQLSEVRAADLRFTHDEATTYLNGTMGLELDPNDIDSLSGRTEGWIAALQLAALSLQGRKDGARFIANFAGDDRFVVDYLAEEVLDRQSASTRSFLLHTSVLDRLSGALCDAVTGGSGGKAMLEQLDRANLFLVALDDRRHWYRYHHLFADVLRARLLDEEPQLIPELHRRASDWYETNDVRAEAISHAMAGHHFERAAQLIELEGPRSRQGRQEGVLRRWLEALPSGVFADRPVLALGLLGARMSTGDASGAVELLGQIEASLSDTSRKPIYFDTEMFDRLPAQVLVQRAGLALLSGDVDTTIDLASRALKIIEPDDHLRRGSASALMALAEWTAGDLEAAADRYGDVFEELIAAGHLADMLGCSIALGDIRIAQGRLTDAQQAFETGLRWTAQHPGLRGAADMHVGLAEVLIERNLLDEAAHHLRLSGELGESAGLPQHAYRWRVTMARHCRATGDLDRALELIDEAGPLYYTDFSPPVRPVDAIRARVHLAGGNLGAATDWARRSGLTADNEASYIKEFSHITFARVLIARAAAERDTAQLDAALQLLDRLLESAEGGRRAGSIIEIRILQAAAHKERDETPAATDALVDALRRAAPEGHIRLFLHAGPKVTELLRSIASRNDATAHARRVSAATQTGDDTRPATPPSSRRALVDPLSARELDVLRLLRSDLSGPEIARELHVSLNTLRTHTKNIFTKLGATNRREALRRAAELGV